MKKLVAYWQDMDPKIKRWMRPTLGIIAGGALGYTYYATVGCASGACPITSNPVISTFWGAAIGGLVATGK